MLSATALQIADDGDLLGLLKFDERRPVLMWQDVLNRFDSARNKGLELAELKREFDGILKISEATLYRKLTRYREEGILSLFPLRARKRVLKDTSLPNGFIPWWQTLCCDSQRMTGTSAAYRSLFHDWLCAGKVIPGYGTDWRGIYSMEHDGAPAPAVCPYIPDRVHPDGWSLRNLRRYAPDKYCLAAGRIGTLAGRELLPKIPSTRVGLRFGSVFIADDRFHDAQTKFAGNLSAQGVVELGAIELLTAHYCTWGAKPIREKADGGREHLREAFMRYLIVDILCRIGYDPMGCMVIGEHGTARLPTVVQELIARLTGGKVTFETGAVLNSPIAKGLLPGAARGNYRMKAALESAHNRYKNDLALLPGQKGADPQHAPEDLPSKQSYHRALMKACIALAEQNPDLIEQVSTPFPDYYSYMDAVSLIYDRIANDPIHGLEGWAQNHFVIPQFILPGFDQPQPMRVLDNMAPEDRNLYLAMIRRDPRRQVNRLMSRREAFVYCQSRSDLVRLPDSIAPELLGPELGDVLTVQKDATINIPDKYLPRISHQVAAVAVLPSGCHQPLDRGSEWLVHLNPLSATEAFISTTDGIYVGKAPVMIAGTKFDVHHKNLAILNAMESTELKRLAPVAEKRLRDLVKMKEQNVKALTGRDALQDAYDAAESYAEVMEHDLDDADMVAATAWRDSESHEDLGIDAIADLLKRD